MRVLLVSPKDPQVPTHLKYLMGGENTYTQSLLSHPPNGVTYTHHTDALSAGIISHTMWQHLFTWTMKARLLPPDAGFHCLEIHDHVDLIHSHVYGLKLETKHIPVVLSDSSSNMLFLRDYLGWGERKIQHSYFIRRWMAGGLNVYDPNLYLHDAHRLVVWSEFAKNIHVSLGADPEKIVVIPPGIAPLPFPKRKQQDAFTVLFIGVWFERKGGPLVLEVFRRLKKKYKELRLLLIGQLPRGTRLPSDTWHAPYLPQETLYRDIYPQADLLVLVPPKAEGYGMVVLEAMSLGIPAIVTDIYSLPEIVQQKETGFVIPPQNKKRLEETIEWCVTHPSLFEEMGERAKKRFTSTFWIDRTNKKLFQIYQDAVRIRG